MRDQDQLNRRTDAVETDLAQDSEQANTAQDRDQIDADQTDRPYPDASANSPDPDGPQPGRPAGRSAWATTPTQAETTAWVESTDPDRTTPGGRDQNEQVERDVRPDRLDELADDPDRGRFHEPAPQPSALGATTVGGAVAASAMAGGTGAVQRDDQDKDMVAKGDGLTAGTVSGDHDEVDRLQQQTRYQPPAEAVSVRSDESAHTGESARQPESGGPGQPDGHIAPTLFPEADGQDFHDRWREIQLRFVDDPQGSVDESRQLIEEVIDSLTAALTARKDEIGRGPDGDLDTEELRMAIRRHRDLLDQLLSR
ncbi:hypothetical protein ACWDV4_00815 [Micromonospora sp. NPDC003197]